MQAANALDSRTINTKIQNKDIVQYMYLDTEYISLISDTFPRSIIKC